MKTAKIRLNSGEFEEVQCFAKFSRVINGHEFNFCVARNCKEERKPRIRPDTKTGRAQYVHGRPKGVDVIHAESGGRVCKLPPCKFSGMRAADWITLANKALNTLEFQAGAQLMHDRLMSVMEVKDESENVA